jgi:hypothetical protein
MLIEVCASQVDSKIIATGFVVTVAGVRDLTEAESVMDFNGNPGSPSIH